MGADLIGNFMFFPQQPTQQQKELVLAHIKKVESITNKYTSVQLAEMYDKDDKEITEFLESAYMEDFAYELSEECGSGDQGDWENCFDNLNNYLETMQQFYKDWKPIEGRDYGNCTVMPLGNPITVFYAGDSSWGDEPEGISYLWTKEMYRGGLGNLLNRISFPISVSTHYIKSLDSD